MNGWIVPRDGGFDNRSDHPAKQEEEEEVVRWLQLVVMSDNARDDAYDVDIADCLRSVPGDKFRL